MPCTGGAVEGRLGPLAGERGSQLHRSGAWQHLPVSVQISPISRSAEQQTYALANKLS